jgi:hypothetical protein
MAFANLAHRSSGSGVPGRRRGRLPGVTGAARLGAAVVAAVVASGALAAGALAAAGPAAASPAGAARAGASPHRVVNYAFIEVRNHKDKSFNQLLGINSHGKIAGYFGSGAKGHPNKGYTVRPPYHQSDFRKENFPGSKQTQVTGLNNHGVTVGFFSTQNKAGLANNNFGFWAHNHLFHPVVFPAVSNSSPPVNQLLGVNDHRVAVGFYVKAAGNNRAYRLNTGTRHFRRVKVPGSTGVVATGINNKGSIAGFFADSAGTHGFFRRHTGKLFILNVPGRP